MKIKKILLCVCFLLVFSIALSLIAMSYNILLFNGTENRGIKNRYIVFQSWSGFTQETRWAIDYASRQWNNRTGMTILYHSATQHNSNYDNEARDYKNLIVKVSKGLDNAPMTTHAWAELGSDGYYYIIEADIVVNADYPWNNTGSSTCLDVQNCMTHEFGHMLGLENVDYPVDATMYKSTHNGDLEKRWLKQDDLNGFNYIYR